MSIFHQHSHPILKYCSSVICLQWRIRVSRMRYVINMSTKQLLKRYKITVTTIQWYVLEPTTTFKQLLPPCFTASRLSASATSRTSLLVTIQTLSINPVSSYVNTSLSHACYTFACVYLDSFWVHILFTKHLHCEHKVSCLRHDLEQAINK